MNAHSESVSFTGKWGSYWSFRPRRQWNSQLCRPLDICDQKTRWYHRVLWSPDVSLRLKRFYKLFIKRTDDFLDKSYENICNVYRSIMCSTFVTIVGFTFSIILTFETLFFQNISCVGDPRPIFYVNISDLSKLSSVNLLIFFVILTNYQFLRIIRSRSLWIESFLTCLVNPGKLFRVTYTLEYFNFSISHKFSPRAQRSKENHEKVRDFLWSDFPSKFALLKK